MEDWEEFCQDDDDREMEMMRLLYDQILVMMDIAVDENPMKNFGAEIGALMDAHVDEACYVERRRQ